MSICLVSSPCPWGSCEVEWLPLGCEGKVPRGQRGLPCFLLLVNYLVTTPKDNTHT